MESHSEEYQENYEVDEKDWWESGEVCRWCGEPLPEVIKEEYTCPGCGSTYTIEERP